MKHAPECDQQMRADKCQGGDGLVENPRHKQSQFRFQLTFPQGSGFRAQSSEGIAAPDVSAAPTRDAAGKFRNPGPRRIPFLTRRPEGSFFR